MTNLRLCLGALVLASSACGLISSDVTDFDLNLPDKNFSIDASRWQVDQPQAQMLFGMSCASAPMICSSAAQTACKMGCSGSCSTETQKCELGLEVSLYQPINLVMEKPELQSINDQPVIKVTVDSLTYDVPVNRLTVWTPELAVYVAPISVMDPKSAEATKIGTIPEIEPGATADHQSIAFTSDGKARLVAMMSAYKTPFNVIVGASLVAKDAQQVPSGKLDAVIHIRAHAGI
jgi:hypothetical protein